MKSGSFDLITKAAIKYSRQIGTQPFNGLIKNLGTKNKDKWSESLCMINFMLVKAPTDKKRA